MSWHTLGFVVIIVVVDVVVVVVVVLLLLSLLCSLNPFRKTRGYCF